MKGRSEGNLAANSMLVNNAAPNNGMHPTADTRDFTYTRRAGGRVMPALCCFGVCVMKRILKACCLALFIVVISRQANAQNLCDRVSEIRIMPFKGERVDDAAYYSLIEAGESALPCLIAKVTDVRKTRDPRQAPTYSDVRVGDVAYFVLVDIAKIDFIELFPAKVQRRYKTEGVYAYFEFVQKKRNRVWLQRKLNEWYRSKYGESARKGAA